MVKRARNFHPGIGQAVAERTILRKKENGKWESWKDVANRVAKGNSLLCKTPEEQEEEFEILNRHISSGVILMSGRHLQHGDETQPERTKEVYTNCSTAHCSFMLFYLLMSGSGVGRCYDDDMMLVNWDHAPTLRCVLDENHPDYDFSAHESVRDAKHKYGSGKDVLWFTVEDTREGWAKALEVWENAAFEKVHKDKLLILDFSKVRPKGSPIKGMQGRPASGPVPLMNAFNKAATLKGAGLARWKQAIYIDHYFAECVLVGGARRAARMSVKNWRDFTVLDFITIKRPIEYSGKKFDEIIDFRKSLKNSPASFLWSSNNSILVDAEFWRLVGLSKRDKEYKTTLAEHARKVFRLATSAAYGDGTGEPGFINVDKLNHNARGLDKLKNDYIGSRKYQVFEDTQLYLNRLLKAAKKKKYFCIVNPCVTADTWILTEDGPRQVLDLLGTPFTAIVDGKKYKASGFFQTGVKQTYLVTTNRGYSLKLTDNHQLLADRSTRNKTIHEWIEVKDLLVGDKIVLCNQANAYWDGDGSFEHGWLLGNMTGDGGYNPEKYRGYLRFWGESQQVMSEIANNYLRTCGVKLRSDFVGATKNIENDSTTMATPALDLLAEGLLEPFSKNLTTKLEKNSSEFYRGFLRGIFDADGTVLLDEEKGRSVRLSQINLERLYTIQRMLARLGIISTLYENRKEAGWRKMPDGNGGEKLYWCQANHELVISKDNINRFAALIGFNEPAKVTKLAECLVTLSRGPYKEQFLTEVKSIDKDEILPVFDCTVEEVHAFDANGVKAHNCSEISLAVWSGFCVIADLVFFHAQDLDEAEEALRAAVRALIRTNMMESVYDQETARTNRIGIGITGIHEFAWKFFGYGFRDLIDEEKSKDFWMTLARFKRAVKDEAKEYSLALGLEIPVTDTTIKPAGTTSKLFGLTEGWHLPAMVQYLRWVQFSENDPLVEVYKKNGYPYRHLKTYKNTVIIGFPTSLTLTTLGLGDKLVTASEATPEEQYKWLMLGEKYWIRGVDENGEPLSDDTGNQISYTLKYNPKEIDYKQFVKTLKKYQSQVRCCSIMPQEESTGYEYLPEEAITKAEYEAIASKIKNLVEEDIDFAHVDCAGGACPIDFNKKE